MSRKSAAYSLLVLVMAGFSGYGVILQLYGHRGVDASVLSALRDTLAFPVLLGAGWFLEGYRVPTSGEALAIAALGLFGIFGNQIFFILGLYQTNATLASLMQQIIPVLTAAVAMLTGQEPTPTFTDASGWLRVGGMVAAAAGAATIIMSDNEGGIGPSSRDKVAGHLAGELLLLINCCCMTTYLLLQKWLMASAHAATPVPGRKPWETLGKGPAAVGNTDLCTSFMGASAQSENGPVLPCAACDAEGTTTPSCDAERGMTCAGGRGRTVGFAGCCAAQGKGAGHAHKEAGHRHDEGGHCHHETCPLLAGGQPSCGCSCSAPEPCGQTRPCGASKRRPCRERCKGCGAGAGITGRCGSSCHWAGMLAPWKEHPVTLTAWTYFFGMVYMLANALVLYLWFPMYSPDKAHPDVRRSRFDIPSAIVVPLVYAVVVSSSFCYGAITWINQWLPSSNVTAFWPLSVLFTATFSYFIFGDVLSGTDTLGGLLIISGLLSVTQADRFKRASAVG